MEKDTELLKRRHRRSNILSTSVTNSRASSSSSRATMSPLEFQQSNSQRGRRVGGDRMSLLPSQSSLDGPRQVAVGHDNEILQSELLYDEYLQGMAMKYLLKKKKEETEQKIVAELATISIEADHDKEKRFKLKRREIDIIQLSAAMNELDSQFADVNFYIRNNKIEAFTKALFQLHTYLKPLDILEGDNIILPATEKDWKEIEEILKKCLVTLQFIAELIGSKGEVYKDVCCGIKEFVESYNETEGCQKRIQKALCELQILVLKTASLSSKEDDDIDV